MPPVRRTDDRLVDPDLESLLEEEEAGSQVPDDERMVPADAEELLVDEGDDERDVG